MSDLVNALLWLATGLLVATASAHFVSFGYGLIVNTLAGVLGSTFNIEWDPQTFKDVHDFGDSVIGLAFLFAVGLVFVNFFRYITRDLFYDDSEVEKEGEIVKEATGRGRKRVVVD